MSDDHKSITVSTNSGSFSRDEDSISTNFLSDGLSVRFRKMPQEIKYSGGSDMKSQVELLMEMGDRFDKSLKDKEYFAKVSEAFGTDDEVQLKKRFLTAVRKYRWDTLGGQTSKLTEVMQKYTVDYSNRLSDDHNETIKEMHEMIDHITSYLKAKIVQLFNEYEADIEAASVADFEALTHLMTLKSTAEELENDK